MSSRQVVILIAALGLLAAAAAWFLANFERTTVSVRSGYRAEALRNPWLAAERLLQRMGAKASTVRVVAELQKLPAAGTLVLPAQRYTLTRDARQALLDWVDSGGYLIVQAEPDNQPDPLLDALLVKRFDVRNPHGHGNAHTPAEITLPGSESAVQVDLSPRLRLEADDAVFQFDDGSGNSIVLLERGVGLVLVLNELDFASNRDIGEHQHAQFVWEMVNMVPGDRAVYFFNVPARLSLWAWLKEHAWAPLAGAAALLAIWLWHAAPRFGPIAPDPTRSRRRLLDHLRASGRYLWSNGGAQRMLDAARDACLRRIGRAHPDFLALPDADRAQRLAEILGWPEERARQLLVPPNAAKMVDFLQAIHLYHAVQEQLALSARNSPRTKQ